MPPKRNIKPNKSKPPQLLQVNSENNTAESIELELKFDQEILWCITQFEKLISSGKLNDAKKHESIKAINILRKPNVTKIEKIQLMKSYFKDYKAKMAKDEEEVKKSANLSFEVDSESKSAGKFLKRKIEQSSNQPESTGFLFNFNVNDNASTLGDEIKKLSLS
ncbi:unnamed protein product [Chironomus riparius]|uniref:Uncharacterized protein n=1 Tax=Chironomus riparius TaxID=315576 RepID=A0A9N9WTQ2_9DIPT|nr:unnamed protein product [Chironomus riparius]